MLALGPKDKANELSESEELQVIEAFAEAEESLDTTWSDDDFMFDPNL